MLQCFPLFWLLAKLRLCTEDTALLLTTSVHGIKLQDKIRDTQVLSRADLMRDSRSLGQAVFPRRMAVERIETEAAASQVALIL